MEKQKQIIGNGIDRKRPFLRVLENHLPTERTSDLTQMLLDTQDLFYVLDSEQRHKEVYGRWLNKLGLKPEVFLDKTAEELFGKEKARSHVQANERGLQGEQVEYNWSLEANGSRFHYRITLSPQFDQHGKPNALVGIGKDITREREAETILQKYRKLLRFVSGELPFIAYQFQLHPDGSMDVPYVGASIVNLAGLTHEEINNNVQVIFDLIHPDDINRVRSEVLKSAVNLTLFHCEFRVEMPNQDTKWLLCSSKPCRKKDGSTLWDGIVMDISTRKESEEKLIVSNFRLEAFLEVIQNMLSVSGHNDLYDIILQKALAVTGTTFTRGALYLKNDENTLRRIASIPADAEDPHPDHGVLEIEKFPLIANVIKTGTLHVIADTKEAELNASEKKVADSLGMRPVLHLPIRLKGETIAVMILVSVDTPCHLEEEEIRLLEGFAHHVAIVIENRQHLHQLDTYAKELERSIEEQTNAEQERQKLSVAVEQSPVSVVITDTEGVIEYVNPMFTQVTGYQADEAIGLNPRVLKSGSQSQELYRDLWKTISSGNAWTGELHNRKKNGDLFWERAIISPVHDNNGAITNYLAVKEDITDRKRSDERLIESEQRFREIFESLPDISVQGYDRNQKVIYWNKASEKLYGYTREEAIGQKLTDLIIPEAMREEVIAGVENWITNGVAIPSAELDLKRKDGNLVSVYSNHVLLKNTLGEPEMYCIDIDLTELKNTRRELRESEEQVRESELYHRSLLQAIPDIIFVMDRNGVFQDVKTSDYSDLQMAPGQFLGRSITGLFPPAHAEKQMDAIRACFDHKKVSQFEYPLEINGQTKYFSASTVAFGEDRVIVSVRDVTDYQNNLEKISSLLAAREKQNESLRDFTHIVSHNLRIHTANMLGILMVLEMEEPETYRNHFVQMLKSSSDNLEETIGHLNEVLDIRAKERQDLERVDLHAILEKAVTALAPTAEESEVEIVATVPPKTIVHAIPSYLDSIMHSLLSNAIKYCSPDRPSWVRIEAERTEGFTVVRVEDNGVGIDMKRHGRKLFKMYKKLHEETQSVGLGLFITRNQVEAMGGRIEVESEVDKGTLFRVYLPEGN